MAKKGLTRKQLLKEPDEFITLTGKLISWSRQNTKQLVYWVCALVGAIVVVTGYGYYQESRSRSASALLGDGLAKYQATQKTAAENLAAAKDDFTKLLAAYSGAPAARLGQVVFAHYNLAGGALDDAVKNYRQAQEVFGSDPSLSNIILNGLATAHEQKNEIDAAIGVYEKIVQGKSILLKDAALFHLGRLYQQSGQTDKSQKAYGQLNSEFPKSVYGPLAREKMAG